MRLPSTPPALAARRLLLVDGLKLHCLIRGEGEPVLLIHGLGASSHIWDSTAELLPGLCTVAVDLPGCGSSDDGSLDSLPEVARRLDGLMAQLGHHRYAVAGHSLGGAIAVELALLRPERIHAVVLANPAGRLPLVARLSLARGVGEAVFRLPSLAPANRTAVRLYLQGLFGDPRRVTGPMVEGHFRSVSAPGYYRNMLSGLRGLSTWLPHSRPRALRAPTTVLWGMRDPFVSGARGRQVADAVPGARFVPLEDCGHCTPEEAPEATATAVRETLAMALAKANDHRPMPA